MNNQLGSPLPLFITDGKNIAEPSKTGIISIQNGQSIEIFCSDSFETLDIKNEQLLTAKCIADTTFNIIQPDGMSVGPKDLLNVACSAHLKSSVKVNRIFNHNDIKATVGFKINPRRFISVYDVAFNNASLTSMYAQYNISAAISAGQSPSPRPAFRKEGMYKCDCNNLYEKTVQRSTICDQILNVDSRTCDQYFGGPQRYLAHGHLAASADFVYQFEQRSTFNLFNAAPQWQSINNGNWKSLESALRRFVISKNRRLNLYTGTLGVLRLPNGQGEMTELFLDSTGKIPVPKFFYKVVIDPLALKGVVFVSVNNPYISVADINSSEYELCNDVSGKMSWPDSWFEKKQKKVQRVDRTTAVNRGKGYIFACEVTEFLSLVPNLPNSVSSLTERGLLT